MVVEVVRQMIMIQHQEMVVPEALVAVQLVEAEGR
jgi:hypothetical protein